MSSGALAADAEFRDGSGDSANRSAVGDDQFIIGIFKHLL
jgi:hypothetical protein